MQNPIKNLHKAQLFSRNQVIFWKINQLPQELNIFSWNFAYVS